MLACLQRASGSLSLQSLEPSARLNPVTSFGLELILSSILDNHLVMLCVISENDGLWFPCLAGVCAPWEESVPYLFYGAHAFTSRRARLTIEIAPLGGRLWSHENLRLYGFCSIAEPFLTLKSLFHPRVCDEGTWGGTICLCLRVVKLGEGPWKNVRHGRR